MPRSPFRLPPLTDRLRQNFTWRYYYSGEFKFSRAAVQHVRWRRFEAAASLLARIEKPASMLDVGCGPGESTLYLSQTLKAEQAYGLDISPDSVWFANELAKTNEINAQFVVGSATCLPFETGSVQLVATFEMIEHLPNWLDFFVETRRVLAPGGHALLTTPNALSIHSMLKGVYTKLRRFDRLNRAWRKDGDFYEKFLPDRLIRQGLREAGFQVLATRRVAFVLTVQPNWSLGPTRMIEQWMERLPGIKRLAVTTVVLARAE